MNATMEAARSQVANSGTGKILFLCMTILSGMTGLSFVWIFAGFLSGGSKPFGLFIISLVGMIGVIYLAGREVDNRARAIRQYYASRGYVLLDGPSGPVLVPCPCGKCVDIRRRNGDNTI